MRRILLVVDIQEGFIRGDNEFLERIKEHAASGYYDEIISTIFVNTPDSNYVKMLNWTKLMEEEKPLVKSDKVVIKNAYGLDDYSVLVKEDVSYDLVGISTEACIMKIAMDLFDRGYTFRVLAELCKSTHGHFIHRDAVSLMNRNLGKYTIV